MATKHTGSCHCQAIRFEVVLDATQGSRCNCSICSKLGLRTAVVKPEAFTVVRGEDTASTYAWGGRTATRYFCGRCGVTCYLRGALPELGGAYVSVSLDALDDIDPAEVALVHWDGRHDNWMAGPRPTPWPIFPTGA